MPKIKAKTTENTNSVLDFIKTVPDQQKQKDAFAIIEIMKKQSGFPPKMWGPAIVGFGSYHYKYESGREGDAPLVGFSPRKEAFVLYFAWDFDKNAALLKKFGKHKTSKYCIYIKKIEDTDMEVFKKMITNSIEHLKANIPASGHNKRK